MHFLDVLTPSVERAVKMTSNGKIGVIGTPATVSSNMYEILIHRINPRDPDLFQGMSASGSACRGRMVRRTYT